MSSGTQLKCITPLKMPSPTFDIPTTYRSTIALGLVACNPWCCYGLERAQLRKSRDTLCVGNITLFVAGMAEVWYFVQEMLADLLPAPAAQALTDY
jgi:hypothetical protein